MRDLYERFFGFLLVLLLITMFINGCASPPATIVQTLCLPMKEYSATDQKALSAELKTKLIMDGSQIARIVIDYKALRDANRACQMQFGTGGWGMAPP